MNKDRIKYLWICYINQASSIEERKEFFELLQEQPVASFVQELMEESLVDSTEKVPLPITVRDEIINHIFESSSSTIGSTRKKIYPMRRILWAAAAASILLIVIGALIKFKIEYSDQDDTTLVVNEQILPGGNKAFITLSDGAVIPLDESKEEIIASNSSLVYANGDPAVSIPAIGQYATLNTPRGGQYRIILPDGSKVWLNAESSLTYPVDFSDTSRIVDLDGEAYFEVVPKFLANGKRVPFIVKAPDQNVEVLGTSFNINAYSNENGTKTSLLEGSVRVSLASEFGNTKTAKILKPGQQSWLRNKTTFRIENVDLSTALAWKDGMFSFQNADIQEVMRQFERWYDVQVHYDGKVPEETFSGKIYRNDQITKLYELLTYYGLSYTVQGRVITIKGS